MKVAIHQPNFFPWLGFFHKIYKSDKFIFLDNVQFQKTGGVWTNRVKLNISNNSKWFSAPIERSFNGVKMINEMHFSGHLNWREKLIRTIHLNYKKSEYFAFVMPFIEPLIFNNNNNISEYNINSILKISEQLFPGEQTFYKSSDILCNGSSNHLLCCLVKSVNGKTYLCGGGSGGYINEDFFKNNNINLQMQNYNEPDYKNKSFNGLSIIDCLMNNGFKKTAQIIND
jgi:hypothetical protein